MNDLLHKVRECLARIFYNHPEFLFKANYFRVTKRFLNTRNPKTLYDKIAYLAFHTDTTLWSVLADKVAVKQYLEDRGFGACIPKNYGVWEHARDINFDDLPKQFVLKTNNASATNIIVSDKNKLDIDAVCKKIDKWMNWEYGKLTAQPHYSRIKPLILAEEFLVDEETTKEGKLLTDYKFICINGEPIYVLVATERKANTHECKLQIFDMNWNAHPEYVSYLHTKGPENLPKPESFEKMKQLVRALACEFSFVRVDLYEVNDEPVFGELTFTPGLDSFSQIFMEELGKMINIEKTYINGNG